MPRPLPQSLRFLFSRPSLHFLNWLEHNGTRFFFRSSEFTIIRIEIIYVYKTDHSIVVGCDTCGSNKKKKVVNFLVPTNGDLPVLNNQTSEMSSTHTHFSKATKFKATKNNNIVFNIFPLLLKFPFVSLPNNPHFI